MTHQEYEWDSQEQGQKPTLEAAMAALHLFDPDAILSKDIYYGLSGLTEETLPVLEPVWFSLEPEFRVKVLGVLAETAEADFELDFRGLGYLAIRDDYPLARAAAIDLLWDEDSLDFMHYLVSCLQQDASPEVRAASASALGRYLLMGEYEELPEGEVLPVQDAVVAAWLHDLDQTVRRRALESISNSSHDIVPEAIQEAYESGDHEMRVSALFAMGRTYDPIWEDAVMHEMNGSDPELRYEATRAAGELMLHSAIPQLSRIAADDEGEIQATAIWALGEIGGAEVNRVLAELAEVAESNGDEDLLDIIEDAIAMTNFIGGEREWGDDEFEDDVEDNYGDD